MEPFQSKFNSLWCCIKNYESLQQQVLRDLLGIQATEAISVRFAYPPYDAISALSAILQEPNHVVQLVVSKLPNASSTNHIWVDSKKTAEVKNNHTADPYCRLRKTHPNTVRTKCNLEEMNKLFSQLTEVSLSLQRTQQECDQIARRCRLTEQTDTTTTTTTPVVCPQQSKCMVFDDDSKIERLITAAESITQHAAKNSSKNPGTCVHVQYISFLIMSICFDMCACYEQYAVTMIIMLEGIHICINFSPSQLV